MDVFIPPLRLILGSKNPLNMRITSGMRRIKSNYFQYVKCAYLMIFDQHSIQIGKCCILKFFRLVKKGKGQSCF